MNPRDLTLFFKRLRKKLPHKIRYFAVGEYGEKYGRPHYHAIIFGLSQEQAYQHILPTWGKGNIDVKPLVHETAQYTCGYVVKKLTNKDSFQDETTGVPIKHAEFFRCSQGIGKQFVETIKESIKDVASTMLDVPRQFNIAKKVRPLGRYLVTKLRVALDRPPETPLPLQQEFKQQVIDIKVKFLKHINSFLSGKYPFSRTMGLQFSHWLGNVHYADRIKAWELRFNTFGKKRESLHLI